MIFFASKRRQHKLEDLSKNRSKRVADKGVLSVVLFSKGLLVRLALFLLDILRAGSERAEYQKSLSLRQEGTVRALAI